MKILKHSIYNLLGLGLPLLVAVFTIPILIQELGEARFGLLMLIWAIVSYFGLFDLGFGRALTHQVAIIFTKNEYGKLGPVVGTALVIMAILGVLAGIFMALAASWGVGLISDVPDREEAIYAVYSMAIAIPFIVLTSAFRGILEARHAFGIVNLIRFPMGLFTFLGPLAVVLYESQPRLDHIAMVLVSGRLIACCVYAFYAWRILLSNRSPLSWHPNLLKHLFITGGWMTVSNIVSPFMGYVDRFIIGTVVSASAVTYYATPHELISKLSIFPGALTAVLFPTFAAQVARRDEQAWPLFINAVYWLFLALLPVTVITTLFAHELLTLWINHDFAEHSAIFLQIFSIGILMNCLTQVAFTLIQGLGASKFTALSHLIELPIFLLALWFLTSAYGSLGAVVAWLLRITLDTALMFTLCHRLLNQSAENLFSRKVLGLGLLAMSGFAGVLINPITARILWAMFIVGVSILLLLVSRKALRTVST